MNDLAQELLDAVIDEVGNLTDVKAAFSTREGMENLKSCSLVARAWSPRARHYLFREVEFASMDLFSRWKAIISHGEDSPHGCVQTLRFREKTDQWITAEAFSQILPHLAAFPKVENLIFTQYDIASLVLPLQQASVPTFLQSIRYLEVGSTAMSSPKELLALIDCFPHLEDLNIGHGRVRRLHERGVYPQVAAGRFRGRLYIISSEREDDAFLREFAARPVWFQEVRVAESLFRQPLCDLIAACASTLRRFQVLAPSRVPGALDSPLGQLPTHRPLMDLSSFVRLQHLRLSTRNLDTLDDWILPMLHTITNTPEELTLHEAPMLQSHGIEYADGGGWKEIDVCLGTLAIKAAERGHKLKLVLTTGALARPQSEAKLRSKLSSFTELGNFTVLSSRLTYSHTRGPF